MRFVRRPSPAMVVAWIALLVALGGTGYAAVKLPRNSVGTRQLKSNAVTGAKVKDGSLGAKDFAAGELSRGPQGPEGPQGARGDKGDKGDTGDGGGANVRGVFRDFPPTLTAGSSSYTTIATMANVDPGSYAIYGTTNLGNLGGTVTNTECRLTAGSDFDESRIAASPSGHVRHATQVMHTFAAAGTITLACLSAQNNTTVNYTKISAFKLSQSRNDAVTG